MIQIEVVKSEVREIVKRATGEVFRIPEVQAFAHGIGKYPFEIKFGVQKGAEAPKPGFYELAPESFYQGKFGALSLRAALVLKPSVGGLKRAA
jgi:hypothetical protein